MKMGWARALLLAVAAMAACGKSGSAGTGDAGPHGPTHLVVKWAFTGKPASESECSARMGAQVFVTLSGTIDPTLHKTATVNCEKGTFDFGSPLVEDLGLPFIEASLLDEKGVTVAKASTDVTPVPGSTTVTLDFFPAMNTGGGGMGSSSSSSTTSSSTTSSSSGGTGGTGGSGTSSSSTTSSSTTSSSTTGGTGGMGGMTP